MGSRTRYFGFLLVTIVALLVGCANRASRNNHHVDQVLQTPSTQEENRGAAGTAAPTKQSTSTGSTRPKSGTTRHTNPQTPQTANAANTAESHNQPFKPKMPGVRISNVNVPGPYVALTFDDGPHAQYTPQVLDILKRHHAKATFFVVGRSVASNASILARAVAEGHEIGAHTWSHIKLTASSMATIKSEMDRTCAAIASATGRYPTLMRPPYGSTNPHIQDYMMSNYGLTTVMWSVETRDWSKPGVQVVINRAVGGARNGSIILLHDIHASTLAAVEDIVTGLQRRGFTLVTVSELIEMGRRAAQQSSSAAPAEAPAQGATKNESAYEAPSPTAVTVTPEQKPAQEQEPAPADVTNDIPSAVTNPVIDAGSEQTPE